MFRSAAKVFQNRVTFFEVKIPKISSSKPRSMTKKHKKIESWEENCLGKFSQNYFIHENDKNSFLQIAKKFQNRVFNEKQYHISCKVFVIIGKL